jgi:hypothetical protein
LDLNLFGIIIGIGLAFFFLYTRKKKWAKPQFRWIFCSMLFLVGFLGLVSKNFFGNKYFLLYWGLCIPLAYYSIDRFLRYLSYKICNRDFILWLRGSVEIDDTIFGSNPHVKSIDKFFSILLLLTIMVLTIIGAALAHKYKNQ